MSATTVGAAGTELAVGIVLETRGLAGAVQAVREAREVAGHAEHITDAITSAAALIVAIEGLEATAKAVAAAGRTVLRNAMESAGCWSLGGEALSVALVDAPRLVTVTDKAALLAARPDLFSTPEPELDRKRIGNELRRGITIEGASLTNGGSPQLRITTNRRQKP